MSLFTQRFIDDLRAQASIVRVIEEYVPLKRAGAKYKGLCPFHSEKTPSFSVDADKGLFYCFGCHAGGDAFKFLELHEKVGFQDAVRMLAQKFGVAIPEDTDGTPEDARRDASLREALLKVHEIAAAFFREQLAGPGGARARRQLADRDVDATDHRIAGPRVCAGRRATALMTRLLAQGFPQGLLMQSGLIAQRDNGDVVDRFRNRLMVPICRDTGPVIAFGGRAMDDGQVPKYLNSPETPIYSKGRTLYGLNLSKAADSPARLRRHRGGLFRLCPGVPVECGAGRRLVRHSAHPAAGPAAAALHEQGRAELRPRRRGPGRRRPIVRIAGCRGVRGQRRRCWIRGEDPDTYIRRHGPGGYRARLRSSRPYLEYLLDQAAVGVDFGQDDSRRQFLGKMLAVAARIPDPATRDQFGDRIAHKARITEEVVRTEIRKAAVGRRSRLTDRELPSFGQVKYAEKGLIWALIHNPDEAFDAMVELDAEDLNLLAGREVFEMARSLRDPPEELLTIFTFGASKYGERPARHQHRRRSHAARPGRRLRPGDQAAEVRTRSRCHPT